MRTFRYHILHNVDAMWSRGYEPGDRLVRGWADTIEVGRSFSPVQQAERVFARHNRDDRPDGQLAPSMSVGDVVLLNGQALTCQRTGFTECQVEEVDVREGPYRDVIEQLREEA